MPPAASVDARHHGRRFVERGGADRHHQKVLDVDAPAGVSAPAENLNHRHREHGLRAVGQVTPERLAPGGGGSVQGCHRHRHRGVAAEARLVRRAVEIDQP